MPFIQLKIKPGVNRESTALANEGAWYESDKVRFRSGYPEKIGGWVLDQGAPSSQDTLPPASGFFAGVCRSITNWLTLTSNNLLGIGTNEKFYIQNGPSGIVYDVTPLRLVTTGDATFSATDGSSIINVLDPGHGAASGDYVFFTGAAGLGGAVTAGVLNREFRVTLIDSSNYAIDVGVAANASDVGDGGAAVVASYLLAVGGDIYRESFGWGAGGWGGVTANASNSGWGESAPEGAGIGVELRIWTAANFGENLIINPRGGGLYYWETDITPNTFNRAALLTGGDTPTSCLTVLVSDNSRFVLAFGVNDYGSNVNDPLLVRWSDQENLTVWTPSATNQAGSYRLSRGSAIVTARQTRQEVLVWTDAALYSMQYLGPPFVWGTQILADNISIVSPNAAITVNNITYWMGAEKFYIYSGRVEPLKCDVRQYVFNDFSLTQQFQVFSASVEAFNEVWWFYCSSNSTEVDRYVLYNYVEGTWAYGNLQRTAWLDSPLRGKPIAAGYNGRIYYHETGADDGTTNPPSPIEAFIQSADFDIGDGDRLSFVDKLIPDVTFDGSTVNNPAVEFAVRPRRNPGAPYGPANEPRATSDQNYVEQRAYVVQEFTEMLFVRARGRQMAIRVGSDGVGVAWQLGIPRVNVRPDGRR